MSTAKQRPHIKMDMKEKKTMLLTKILKNCNDPRNNLVQNILLVGSSGCGKSSLLNTLGASVIGEYRQLVRTGRGISSALTSDLKCVKNCGVHVYDIQGDEDEDILKEIVPKLPNIVDMPGLRNENNEEIKEIIELIINGFIPWGTTINELCRQQTVGMLSSTYNTSEKSRKINKVVFVQNCFVPVPCRLIECLLSVLNDTDQKTGNIKYQGDIFVAVICPKKDKSSRFKKTENDDDIPEKGSDDFDGNKIESEQIETKLAREFTIQGALTHNLKWLNIFSDENGYDDPEITNVALEFLVHMTRPTVLYIVENASILSKTYRYLKFKYMQWKEASEISFNQCIFIFFIIVIVVFAKCIK